jgi:hypothetical protein
MAMSGRYGKVSIASALGVPLVTCAVPMECRG